MKYWKHKLYHFLRWTEKYTKTDMTYIAKGGFWLSITQVVSAIAGLLLLLILANFLPPNVLGTYKFVLASVGLIGTFTLTGMSTAITRAVAKDNLGTLKTGFKTQLIWSLSILLISLGVALYYLTKDNLVLSIGFIIVGTFTPLIKSSSLFIAFLEGKKDFKTETLLNIFKILIPTISLITTVYYTSNLIFIIGVYFITDAVISLLAYFFTIKKYNETNAHSNPEMINYSKHLSLMNTLPNITLHVDKILIFSFLGPANLAIYTLALAPVEKLRIINKIISRLAFPKLSQKNYQDLKKTLLSKTLIILLLMTVITICYIVTAPYIFKFLFPLYLDSVIYSQIYSLILLIVPATMFGQSLTAHMKKKELYIVKTITSILNIILILILIPLFNIMGAIIAILLAKLFNAMIAMYLFYNSKS